MKIKLFWSENCPKCPQAKDTVSDFGEVEYYNVGESDGLAEAAFYGVMSTPSIILVNKEGREVTSWLGEVPQVGDLERCLSQ